MQPLDYHTPPPARQFGVPAWLLSLAATAGAIGCVAGGVMLRIAGLQAKLASDVTLPLATAAAVVGVGLALARVDGHGCLTTFAVAVLFFGNLAIALGCLAALANVFLF